MSQTTHRGRSARAYISAALHRVAHIGAPDPGLIDQAPAVPVRTIIHRFWPYARPDLRWFLLGMVPVALLPLVETVEIWLFQIVVDDVLAPRDLGLLPALAGAFLGMVVATAALGYADTMIFTRVSQRFTLRVRTALFEHLLRLPPDPLDRRRRGDLLSRLSGDVGAIETLMVSGTTEAISAIARMVLFAGAMLLIDVQLAVVSLLLAPLFWGAARGFAGVARDVARERRRRSGGLMALADESLSHAVLVQASRRERHELARFTAEGEAIVEASLASARLRSLLTPIVDLIELAGALVIVGLGTVALSEGRLSLGELLVFLTYLTQLYRPVRDLSALTTTAFAASGGAERILEIIDQPILIVDPPSAFDPGPSLGALVLDGVSYRYPRHGGHADPDDETTEGHVPVAPIAALDDVSLAFRPGTVTAIVGTSGAGKSTLVKLLLRFIDPDDGRVLLDGHDLRDLTLDAVRRDVAVLLQDVHVLDSSLVDNVRYSRPDATDTEVQAALVAADAAGFSDDLDAGDRSRLAQGGRRLSGGQRQRIAIARLLVQDAPVVVLDEPTASLDGPTARRMMAALCSMLRGRTVIVVTHDPLAVSFADRVVTLEAGRVVNDTAATKAVAIRAPVEAAA